MKSIIAERLSVRLTDLAERVLRWWKVAPTSILLAMKGVACAQTSVLFRNAIKRSWLQIVT